MWNRLGTIGRAALLIFLAQRIGDLLNFTAGLWLVPKHATEAELSVLRPLESICGMIGIPISILTWPCIKALNKHALRGETGKAKALMRDMFAFCAAAIVLIIAVSSAALPWILRRWNIGNGHLAVTIITSAVLGALLPVFFGAMQAMKQFRAYSFVSCVSPFARFITLWLLLPLRGLTGFFAGAGAASLVGVATAVWRYFRDFGRKVRGEPYWHDDRAIFAAFIFPLVLGSSTSAFSGFAQISMLKWIPIPDAAAYYILTRFSDIVGYAAGALTFVLFPVFSERHEAGADSGRTLVYGMTFCIATGAVAGIAFTLCGPLLLGMNALWRPYAGYSELFWILTLTTGIRLAYSYFTMREIAALRFTHTYVSSAVNIAAGLAIYAVSKTPRYATFGLREVLLAYLAPSFTVFLYALAVLAIRRKRNGKI